MRVLTVLFALVATPLMVCVSQGLTGKSSCANGNGTANRSAQGTAHAHKGLCAPLDPPGVVDSDGDGVADNVDTCANTPAGTQVDASGCAVQSSPPPQTPPACGNGVVGTGGGSISGAVFDDKQQWPLLFVPDWCVELRDASGAVVATATTGPAIDDNTNFVFSAVGAGTYTVCEQVKTGWRQDYPTFGEPCGSGLGYMISIGDMGAAGFSWFGNLVAP